MEDQQAPPAPLLTSRRLTQVSTAELAPIERVDESTFRTCVVCATEVASEGGSLFRCIHCAVPLYCCDSCRKQDIGTHKKDGFCQALKNLWGRHDLAVREFTAIQFGPARVAWFQERFGEAFDGRNFIQLIKGRWSEDPFYRPVLDCYFELAVKLARHPTSLAKAAERSLVSLLYLKEQTYLVDPYNLDALIVAVLLKLYHEDDAVGVIRYWLDWRSCGPEIEDLRDNRMEKRVLARTWPYPIINDARFDDLVDQFNKFPAQLVGVLVPIGFALTLLVIKMRFITVYRKRAEVVNLFLYGYNDGAGRQLQGDQRAHVLLFVVEGGRGRYFAQRNHANRLMDYIDTRDPTLLRALVDPVAKAERGDDQQVCFEAFLQKYANGEPVIHTIKSVLLGRYMIQDAPSTDTGSNKNNKKRSAPAEDSSMDNTRNGAQKLQRRG